MSVNNLETEVGVEVEVESGRGTETRSTTRRREIPECPWTGSTARERGLGEGRRGTKDKEDHTS